MYNFRRVSRCPLVFLSTPSARRATVPPRASFSSSFYFYPRPPRGGRQGYQHLTVVCHDFYPRPPRGGRRNLCTGQHKGQYFYPRPPRGGRLQCSQSKRFGTKKFLSTPSARRATNTFWGKVSKRKISIHALREEGDQRAMADMKKAGLFLSTPSARRATADVVKQRVNLLISIHALREEGDTLTPAWFFTLT